MHLIDVSGVPTPHVVDVSGVPTDHVVDVLLLLVGVHPHEWWFTFEEKGLFTRDDEHRYGLFARDDLRVTLVRLPEGTREIHISALNAEAESAAELLASWLALQMDFLTPEQLELLRMVRSVARSLPTEEVTEERVAVALDMSKRTLRRKLNKPFHQLLREWGIAHAPREGRAR